MAAAEGQGTITFDKNTVTQGDKVSGYRLLNIVSEKDIKDPDTGKIETKYIFAVNDTYKENIVSAIRTIDDTFEGRLPAYAIENSKIVNWFVDSSNTKYLNAMNIDKFARAFMKSSPTPDTDFTNIELKKNGADTKDVPVGYYLIEHTTLSGEHPGDTDFSSEETYAKYMMDTVGSKGVTIELKNSTVTLTKKVKDNEIGVHNAWDDSADYAIGDKVQFQLTGTLPKQFKNGNVMQGIPNDYEYFEYQFVDNFDVTDKGMPIFSLYGEDGTQPLDMKVEVYSSPTATTPKGVLKPNTDYSLEHKITDTRQTGFSLSLGAKKGVPASDPGLQPKSIRDVQSIKTVDIRQTDIIKVTYSAYLLAQAKIGAEGNTNTAHLLYANNPNTLDIGKTPQDFATVFTYEFDGNKSFTVDPNKQDLPTFELFRETTNEAGKTVWQSLGESKVTEHFDTNDPKQFLGYRFGWRGIDAGNYKLVETYTPAGFTHPEHPVLFTITAIHENDDNDIPVLKDLNATVTSDTNKIVVDTMKGTINTGTITAQILNRGGNVLPDAGGIGTAKLYIAGIGIIVLASFGIIVALRKQRNS
ncbi:hypothetical protein D2E26_0492 [Bifidobacterium dolichotidis]|uniref:Uncharacterized protein n=1 Tax=Bifidobacterium dolichotidis TaxID=2306976 RepID=A0A430FSV1_9BIFI|nr:hypothetical protein [Bifidobacterium dolichotidis]RSX55929.1 hypothetical protein D2E26_0492 [Bifidobacterium dolichotidis]